MIGRCSEIDDTLTDATYFNRQKRRQSEKIHIMSYLVTMLYIVLPAVLALLLVIGQVASSTVSSCTLTSNNRRSPFSSLALWKSNSVIAVDQIGRGGGSSTRSSKKLSVKKDNTNEKDGPFQIFLQTIKDGRRHLMAAAIARTISIFIMYPVDAIKTRLQLKQINPFRLQGLFNGVGGSLAGQVPYGVLAFGSYEMYKSTLFQYFPNTKPIVLYAVAAVLGDMTGSGWICPSEVVKQQVQAGMHATTGAAIANIWKNKGLAGFYEGYMGGISRDVPFRVAQLTTFEVTKSLFLKMKKRRLLSEQMNSKNRKSNNSRATAIDTSNVELTPIEAAMCGAVSGSFSAAITSPLDRIKTLLMTNSQLYGGTVLSCATKIWKEEGLAGITTGMVPRVIYIAPSVVIFFVVYEMSQQKLKKYYGDKKK